MRFASVKQYWILITSPIPWVSNIDCVSDNYLSIEWIWPSLPLSPLARLLSIGYQLCLRLLSIDCVSNQRFHLQDWEYWLRLRSALLRTGLLWSDQPFRSHVAILLLSIEYWYRDQFLEHQPWLLEYRVNPASASVHKIVEYQKLIVSSSWLSSSQ